MRTDELKANFALNIKNLRGKVGLTQAQLGEKLGFSDKTISKWENGDVMPDVFTLDHIASYFKLTVNDLIKKQTAFEPHLKKRHALIILCTFFGIMALACICYFFLAKVAFVDRAWLVFLVAPIVFFVSMIVLMAVFYDYKYVILAVSLLTWSIAFAFFFSFLDRQMWELFLIAGILQVLYVVLLFVIMLYRKKENRQINE